MERKLLTTDDLEAIEGISAEDKALINQELETQFGCDEGKECLATRGFLAQQFIDFGPDHKLREELDGIAAAFADGWNWCKEHGRE